MGLEIVVGLAMLMILVVIALTVIGVGTQLLRSAEARTDLVEAIASGAQPPSLHPRIDPGLCMGSGMCVEVCPENDVLQVLDGQAHVVNPTSCIGHGECLRACPVDAITLVLGTDKRGIDIPLIDKDFQTNVPGIYVVGELGGMGLIYNAMTQGMQCMDALLAQLQPKTPGVHQVLIVGAGPAGLAASLKAMEAGIDFLTVDQDTVGGTVLQYPRHKLVMTKPVTLPLYGTIQARDIQKEALLEIWQEVLAKTGLAVRTETRVESVRKADDGLFDVTFAGGEHIRTQRVVLAIGRRGTPMKLGVPGEELPKVVYRLLEPERYEGRRVLVVGGGDSALEAAVSLSNAGARVTLSYRKQDFGRAKKKNRERIEKKIEAEMVRFIGRSNVTQITRDEVSLETPDGEISLPNDDVLVFAGGLLPTRFLGEAGVAIERYTGQAYAPANPDLAVREQAEPIAYRPPKKPADDGFAPATLIPVDFHMPTLVPSSKLFFHECVGRGAFGEVYRATAYVDGGSSREVAVKVLHSEIHLDSEPVQRLRDEANLLSNLDHPNILRAEEVVMLGNRIAMVVEYIDGHDLATLCQESLPSERAALQACLAVARALEAAWEAPGPDGQPMRLIHRDIKPGNVLISRQGEVKLLDFGIARANMEREAATKAGEVLGTMQFMSPERLSGVSSPAGDVYALGCMIFHMIGGERLLHGYDLPKQYGLYLDPERYQEKIEERLSTLEPYASRDTLDLLRTMLAHEADDRPSHTELVRALDENQRGAMGTSLHDWVGAIDIPKPSVAGDLTNTEILRLQV